MDKRGMSKVCAFMGVRRYEPPTTVVVNISNRESTLQTGSVLFANGTQPKITSSGTESTWNTDENGGTTNTSVGTAPSDNY